MLFKEDMWESKSRAKGEVGLVRSGWGYGLEVKVDWVLGWSRGWRSMLG